MKTKNEIINNKDNPLYHDTWQLLKKYRDVVWSLETSVQQVRRRFEVEFGNSVEEFLDSLYLAGADLNGSNIEQHAKCIERSYEMIKLLDTAVEILRNSIRMEKHFTGCCIIRFFLRSNLKMWMR